MKRLSLCIVVLSFFVSACEKQQNQKLLGPYFRYDVNGVKASFAPADVLNNNHFECTISGDTALNIVVSKLFEGAGVMIKGNPIKDGTYVLDGKNRAYHINPKDLKRYYTTDGFKGTLTIKRNVFQAKTLLNTLEGKFSYNVVDTATNKSFQITNGEFLMEVR